MARTGASAKRKGQQSDMMYRNLQARRKAHTDVGTDPSAPQEQPFSTFLRPSAPEGRPKRVAAMTATANIAAIYARQPRTRPQRCGLATKSGTPPAALPQRLEQPARGKKRTRVGTAVVVAPEAPDRDEAADPAGLEPADQTPEQPFSAMALEAQQAQQETPTIQRMGAAAAAEAVAATAAAAVQDEAATAAVASAAVLAEDGCLMAAAVERAAVAETAQSAGRAAPVAEAAAVAHELPTPPPREQPQSPNVQAAMQEQEQKQKQEQAQEKEQEQKREHEKEKEQEQEQEQAQEQAQAQEQPQPQAQARHAAGAGPAAGAGAVVGAQATGEVAGLAVAPPPAAAPARSWAPQLPWTALRQPRGYSLVVDTETTGFPRRLPGTPMNGFIREQVPYTDLEGWSTARIVSIAWRVLAPDGRMELQEHGYRIVRPVGFVIPADAVQIHGISTQRATQEGLPLDQVLDELMSTIQRWNCGVIVAHNLKYDLNVILSELYRRNRAQDVARLERMEGVCTANCSKFYLGRYYKQAELLKALTDEDMRGAHDAECDAEACAKCYVALLQA